MKRISHTAQQTMPPQLKICFLVHLLKITRVPTPTPSPHVMTRSKIAAKLALKVTVLYGIKQLILGDFPVLQNECLIDHQLICQFNPSKPGAQSKLYFFVDQACSSGLAGHMALDLKEFLCEGDTEVYLKYPLYANASSNSRGPTLKMTIRSMNKGSELFLNEDCDCFLLQKESTKTLHNAWVESSTVGPTMQHHISDYCAALSWKGKDHFQKLDEARLLKLAGAINELDINLKGLASVYENTEYLMNSGDEEFCADSGSIISSHISASHNLRTFSDIGTVRQFSAQSQAFGHKKTVSTSSDLLSVSMNDEEYAYHNCNTECFICSSNGLHAYEQPDSIASTSSSISSSPALQRRNFHGTGENSATVHRKDEKKPPEPKKGPGLLRGIFGAVVVAGVSLLGAKSTSMGKKDRLRNGDLGKVSWTGSFSHPNSLKGRALRNRFYSPRFSI